MFGKVTSDEHVNVLERHYKGDIIVNIYLTLMALFPKSKAQNSNVAVLHTLLDM